MRKTRINLLDMPTLVLNASFEALNIVSARRAFTSVMKGIAVVEKSYPMSISTGRNRRTGVLELPIPHVIKLVEYRRLPHRSRTLSRKGILARDQNTCQYCMNEQPAGRLELDHIIPRSRGGPGTWENLVAACHACNNRKADRTPEEAGMKLARYPKPFTIHTSRHLLRASAQQQEAWKEYMFYKNDTPQETVQ